MRHNIIFQGDCLEHLRSLPNESVDLAFADPPFNLNKKYTNYQDRQEVEAYLEWCQTWLSEMVRVTKPTGSILVHNIPKWLTYFASFLNQLADFKHWIVWDAMGMPLGTSLLPNHYGILYYAKDKKLNKFYEVRSPHRRCRGCHILQKDYGGKKNKLHPFGPLVSDVWTDLHRIRHNKRRDKHPCQLPEPVLERLILMSTDADDVVLDPFAGTGTTLIAAKRLGRQYVGIELEAEYIAIAEEKLTNTQPEPCFDGVWVSQYLNTISTIRDQDWDILKHRFNVPNPIQLLEFESLRFKNQKPRKTRHSPKINQNQSVLFFELDGQAQTQKVKRRKNERVGS